MARVLVIDDEVQVRTGVARYLRFAGHEVLEASDGAQGLALAAQEPLDLVITDINMPELDGIEVILTLAGVRTGMPVIAISGGGLLPKELLLANAAMLGAVYTLPKPFELSELREAVALALGPPESGGSAS